MSDQEPERGFCKVCGQYAHLAESERCSLCDLRKRRAERYANAPMVRRWRQRQAKKARGRRRHR